MSTERRRDPGRPSAESWHTIDVGPILARFSRNARPTRDGPGDVPGELGVLATAVDGLAELCRLNHARMGFDHHHPSSRLPAVGRDAWDTFYGEPREVPGPEALAIARLLVQRGSGGLMMMTVCRAWELGCDPGSTTPRHVAFAEELTRLGQPIFILGKLFYGELSELDVEDAIEVVLEATDAEASTLPGMFAVLARWMPRQCLLVRRAWMSAH